MSEVVKITVRNNGPLRIEGPITLVDHEGKPFDLCGRTMISLCRCGLSETKPLCDGAHKRLGFDSTCPARELPPPPPKP